MSKTPTIVVGYNNSDAARAALAWAADLAPRYGAELVVAYVTSSVAEWELAAVQIDPDPIRRHLEDCLATTWTEPLRARDVPYRTRLMVGRPAEELMRIARAEHALLIVIGMSPRGTLTELVLGSTLHELQQHAVRPVVAVPASWTEPHR